MATASKKRKRSAHTLETKLEIVKALEKGDSQRLVGQKFSIAKSTVADIWRDREKITDTVASSESPAFANKKRCVIRHPKFDLVDEACWKWFCQQRSKGAPVSGVLLQKKARSFFSKLYPDADPQSFKGSTGGYQSSTHAMESRTFNYEEKSCPLTCLLSTLSARSWPR